jgi:hypothetical protein
MMQFEAGQSHDAKVDFDSEIIRWSEGFFAEFDKDELPIDYAKEEKDYEEEVKNYTPWYDYEKKDKHLREIESDSEDHLTEHINRALGILCPMDESYDPAVSADNKNSELKEGSFE